MSNIAKRSILYRVPSLSSQNEDKKVLFSKDSSDEMGVLGSIQSYADEPSADASGTEDDSSKDQDGFAPIILSTRF